MGWILRRRRLDFLFPAISGISGHITQNWRGRPLLSRAVVVNLIGNTTTAAGLRIRAELDENAYAAGITVSNIFA